MKTKVTFQVERRDDRLNRYYELRSVIVEGGIDEAFAAAVEAGGDPSKLMRYTAC